MWCGGVVVCGGVAWCCGVVLCGVTVSWCGVELCFIKQCGVMVLCHHLVYYGVSSSIYVLFFSKISQTGSQSTTA